MKKTQIGGVNAYRFCATKAAAASSLFQTVGFAFFFHMARIVLLSRSKVKTGHERVGAKSSV